MQHIIASHIGWNNDRLMNHFWYNGVGNHSWVFGKELKCHILNEVIIVSNRRRSVEKEEEEEGRVDFLIFFLFLSQTSRPTLFSSDIAFSMLRFLDSDCL